MRRFFLRHKILVGFVSAIAIVAAFLVVSFFSIGWSEHGSENFPGGYILRDSSGDIMRVTLGEKDIDCRPYYVADENDWIVKALVAAEDGEFWNHNGVRPLSILRAFFQNVFYRRRISGASTITMQAVRLIKPHPKTLWWKWCEAVMAMKMERKKSKIWIISQYLNRAPFGSNFVGIEAAATGWFGKQAKDLGIGEAAMLAGMVQAPSRFRPDRSYDRAFRRRDYVLERMKKLSYLTDDQFEFARSVRPKVALLMRPFKYPHYCNYYLSMLEESQLGHKKCFDIKTPLDADIQTIVESAVNLASQSVDYSVASVVVKVSTGEVVALHCSGDYFNDSDGQVNTATSPRPAGSTLKPFLASLAMDRGLVTPDERLQDSPMVVKGYRPRNFDSGYRGRVSLADSLVLSLNIPFVRLLSKVGVVSFADKLRELGFRNLGAQVGVLGLGLAIGNAEVTLVELVKAYAVIARGGDNVFSQQSCYLVSDMLSRDERSAASLGHIAQVAVPRFAWKTGTSSAYRDAWTVAWNTEYAIGVWCGHKRGGFGDESLVGAKAAAPICWKIARLLSLGSPWFKVPDGIRSVEICSLTGLPASADCPKTEQGRVIVGHSSLRPCSAHRRGEGGKIIEVTDKDEKTFKIISPENEARYELVDEGLSEKLIFRVAGNVEKLWWFVNGEVGGETKGIEPFVMEMKEGTNLVSAVNEDGEFSTIKIYVERGKKVRLNF